jgi:hypothetical protein
MMGILRNLPAESQMQADIIQVLKDRGGKSTRSEVINELVKKWRLTPDELSYHTPGGYTYYQHRIDGAANRLRSTGRITAPEKGIWQLASAPIVTELAKEKEEETPRLTHDELVQKVKEIGRMLGKNAEGPWGPVYKHDCVWRDNPYANPRLVWEVCDKGNLDKDIASLIWAVKNWSAKGILVLFEESDFYTAQKKLAQESQIYPLKADDMLKLHSLSQAGDIQTIKSIFTV